MKDKKERVLFNIINSLGLILLACITLYPFLYVLAASLSDSFFIARGEVGILPKGINIEAYRAVLRYPMIGVSYRNTVVYTVAGTTINIILTAFGAYPLSRKQLYGRKLFTFIIFFTMLFSGGMIPTYLVVRSLGLINSIWAMLLPGAVSAWNLIIMKTFFEQQPVELEEAARIDGCSEMKILFLIIFPLSLPALMTIGLFYAVNHWNSFFSAMIYLNDRELFPIQIILRQIVLINENAELLQNVNVDVENFREGVKYATIMVATVPILVVYPFIQKYFAKGVMVGAIKG